MPEPIFMKLGTYVVAPEPNINGVLHKSIPSVLYVYPSTVSTQWFGKTVTTATNTHATTKLLEASFTMRSVLYRKKSLWVCVSSTVTRQRLGKHVPAASKNFEGVVFYAVRVVSNESRRLPIPKTSCLFLGSDYRYLIGFVLPRVGW
jgi:hypothetical protein